jgi:hypothetical protein
MNRRTLTLNPAKAVKTVKVQPVKKSGKPSKPCPQKEQKRLENIRLNAEETARRKAQIEKAQPLFDAYIADKTVFQETLLIDDADCLRPLMIGARKAIFNFFKTHPDLQDCTNSVLNDLIAKVLRKHVAKPEYIAGLVKFNDRFDLDGKPVHAISEKHKDKAIERAKDRGRMGLSAAT